MREILLYILAGLISVFSQDIRAALSTQSNKALGRWASWNRQRYVNRLADIQKLHENSYKLLLFALTQVGAAGMATLFMVVVYFATYVVDSVQHVPFSFEKTGPVDISVVGGIWSGQITKVFITAALLSSYDKAVPMLEARIAKYARRADR